MAESSTVNNPADGLSRIPAGLSLTERYALVRQTSEWLAAPLSAEDATVQSMPDVSPSKWHLAHVTWFFETFVLEPHVENYRPFDPAYRVLFNSYYNQVGPQFPRAQRGLITRPGLGEVLRYREHVDRQMCAFLEDRAAQADAIGPRLRYIIEVGLHHEQQHQELLLMDIKHILSINPLNPAYRPEPRQGEVGAASSRSGGAIQWLACPGGESLLGHEGAGFAYDNEGPAQRVLLQPFELASRLVTCGEWLAFVDDDGYRRPELWLDDGWATVQAEHWSAPLYWRKRDGSWRVFSLLGERDLAADEPVCHMSYYEAEAYARWAGARLPTEAEWEVAASDVGLQGNLLEDGQFHPVALPAAETGSGPRQMIGDLWEFTASPYTPYPGFRTPDGALGEYNGKFMINQMVLRGGSFATPSNHIRTTYRNFFHPSKRWQFGGIRLAR